MQKGRKKSKCTYSFKQCRNIEDSFLRADNQEKRINTARKIAKMYIDTDTMIYFNELSRRLRLSRSATMEMMIKQAILFDFFPCTHDFKGQRRNIKKDKMPMPHLTMAPSYLNIIKTARDKIEVSYPVIFEKIIYCYRQRFNCICTK